MASKAGNQVNTVFGVVLGNVGEEAITKIMMEMDTLLQGWQQAVVTFQELKSLALTKVPDLGPFFGQQGEGAQEEQGTGSGGPMEVETVQDN